MGCLRGSKFTLYFIRPLVKRVFLRFCDVQCATWHARRGKRASIGAEISHVGNSPNHLLQRASETPGCKPHCSHWLRL